jgi:hypothetical protein
MPLGSRHYVWSPCVGGLTACQLAMRGMSTLLHARRAAGEIAGYAVEIFETAQQLEDEGLPTQEITTATGDRFPVAFVTVSWEGTDDAPPPWLDAFAEQFELRRL